MPNRRFFTEQLELMLEDSELRAGLMAVLFLDLDRFGRINESLGQSTADRLLRLTAERILRCVRSTDLVARPGIGYQQPLVSRFGGDEFVVLLSCIPEVEVAAAVAGRLAAALSEPVRMKGQEIRVTASMGISLFPHDGDSAEELLRNAQSAAKHAKDESGDSCQHYTESMNASALQRLTLESELSRALEREEFILHFQPQQELTTGRIVGAEALLRWRHPDKGPVPPGDFIPVCEETGLIHPLGDWVLRGACHQARMWQEDPGVSLRVAVNISFRQFARGDLAERVRRVLDDIGLDPSLLEIELTESVLLEAEGDSLRQLRELKALGVCLALDDFGTGYSSLSYLTRLPVDRFKIDRSFMEGVPDRSDSVAVVRAILAMGHSLDLSVIAEGVETEEQIRFLRQEGCPEVQGFFFSRAVSADKLTEMLKREPVPAGLTPAASS